MGKKKKKKSGAVAKDNKATKADRDGKGKEDFRLLLAEEDTAEAA